jgi:phosphoesterase RecJ-like protein
MERHTDLRPITAEQFRELVELKERFVISTHTNPDGDAVGSAIALYRYLAGKGKKAAVVMTDPVPEYLQFLPMESVYVYDETAHAGLMRNAEVIVLLDLNDSSRVKRMEDAVLASPAITIVIDHHLDPSPFAHGYMTNTEACSTSEILYDVISGEREDAVTPEIALALYVGIMTDTGSFRFDRTTPRVHRIVADLLERGVDATVVYRNIYDNFPLRRTELLGRVLAGMDSHCDDRVTILTVSSELFEDTGTTIEDVENMVNYGLSIRGVVATALLTELGDGIKISFRGRDGFAVNGVAAEFGGGGHKYAAGAFVKDGELARVREEVAQLLCGLVAPADDAG